MSGNFGELIIMKIFIKIENNEPMAKLAENLLSEAIDKEAILYFIKHSLAGEFLKIDDYIVFRNR
jgi:hypothetical protein